MLVASQFFFTAFHSAITWEKFLSKMARDKALRSEDACRNSQIRTSRVAPCKRIRNPTHFSCWNPESRHKKPESTMVWKPESTLVWNPESRRLESGIQRVEIQNPDAGIRNLEAGIRNLEAGIQNPGPSWILLHRAKPQLPAGELQ